MTSAKIEVNALLTELQANKEFFTTDQIINQFKIIYDVLGGYTQPRSIGKQPQVLYNKLKNDINYRNLNDPFFTLLTNLEFTSANRLYIDVVATVIQVVEMYRHDLMLEVIAEQLESAGYEVKARDFKLSDFFSVVQNKSPDLLLLKDGRHIVVELKMRDPIYLDMKSFYQKYKLSDDYDVVVMNFNSGGFTYYGDQTFQDSVSIESEDYRIINQLIEWPKKMRQSYSCFDLFNKLMSDFDMPSDVPFITGFKESCQELPQYKEIEALYGPYFLQVLDAIDNFNYLNPKTQDQLESAGEAAYSYAESNLLPDSRATYEQMLQSGSYDSYTKLNMNVHDYIDATNKEKYLIKSSYSPSLYVPFNSSEKVGVSRVEHYNQVFSEPLDILNKSEYATAAFSLIKNIMTDVDLGILLGVTSVDIKTQVSASVDVTPDKDSHSAKSKLLMKKSMALYDINMYVNNTFSYADHTVFRSKDIICGFQRKNYQNGLEHNKEAILFSQNLVDVQRVNELINNWNSYYNSFSESHDLRLYRQSFKDFKNFPNEKDSFDQFSYYAYSVSKLMKAMIALSTINTKKYRLVQNLDPNTITIMLPNGDIRDKMPIRYFTVVITKSLDVVELNKIMGIYASHAKVGDNYLVLSKVISLDLNRCKLLENSYVKYMLLKSYYMGFTGYEARRNLINFESILYTNMITLETLSVTENFKNLAMVAYSDYGNLETLIKDKFNPRLKNYTMMMLSDKMIRALVISNDQRSKILKAQNKVELTDDGYDLQNTGFRITDDLIMPISELSTCDPREILQEAYLIFYIGNKTLHGSPQELISLYHVPVEFEREYTQYLDSHSTVIQELTGDKSYGFSFNAMKCSVILAYSKQGGNKQKIRESIQKELALEDHIMSRKQFSSTKSMMTEYVKDNRVVNLSPMSSMEDFGSWLKTVKIPEDVDSFINQSNKMIKDLNTKRRVQQKQASEIYFDKSNKPSPRDTLFPMLTGTHKDGGVVITAKPTRFCRFCMNDVKNASSNKVFDEVLQLTKDKDMRTLRNVLNEMKTDTTDNHFRIFNKDQRTHTDREIYTGNIQSRLCLYPIEKLFLSHDKLLDQEAITISGDIKHKKMYDQRHQLIRSVRNKFDRKTHKANILLSVSSDASKWSARDAYIKYIMCIAFNPYLLPDEKWFYMYFMCRYYYKYIVVTDNVMTSLYELCSLGKSGPFEDITNSYQSNYFLVRSNWLQGNLNRLSSFVHYCSALMVEVTLNVLNDKYGDLSSMVYMVHSDDSSYDFYMILNESNITDLGYRSDYGRFIISIIKTVEKSHSIILNEKKTYISSFYKEFLSTLLVGNVLSYFYVADLLPISSDLAYKTPLDDLASLSSFIQNAFAHSAPYRMLDASIHLINYVALSTYNLNNNSGKSALEHFYKAEESDSFSMVPITIMPSYRLPVNMAGIIPYYCTDAYYVLEGLLANFQLNHSEPIESQLTVDVVQQILPKMGSDWQNYVKACMYSYDSTVFAEESEDPYSQSAYDMAVSSIISVGGRKDRGKIPRYESYKEFLSRKEDILLKYTSHPEWIISRPKDLDLARDSVLANYLMPNFIESLAFSTPALDYGKRIIDSNKSMYRLNIKGFTSEKTYNITELYGTLKNQIISDQLDPAKLHAYLMTYLFSDKEVAYALQVWFTKKQIQTTAKVAMDLKVIMPASIFRRERGALSATSIIKDLLLNNTKVDVIDLKYEGIINYAYSLLTSFDLNDTKIYRSQSDVDEDYIDFFAFKNPVSEHFDDNITEIAVADQEDLRLKIIEIRCIYKSILIRYFKEVKLVQQNPAFKFGNYPTPQAIISTLSKYARKDVITSKVYLSAKKSSRRDDYWLSRIGMYQDEYNFVKYTLSTRYTVIDEKLAPKETDKYRVDAFSRFVNLLFKEEIVQDDITHLSVDGLSGVDYIAKIKHSERFPHKMILNKLGLIGDHSLINHLQHDSMVLNHWYIAHNTLPDADKSVAVYLYKGTFVVVNTQSVNQAVYVKANVYYQGDYNNANVNRIFLKVSKDYREHLRNRVVISVNKHSFNRLYTDQYHNITMNARDRVGNHNPFLFSYITSKYTNIKLCSIDINEKNRYVYKVSIHLDGSKLFDFQFKDNLYYNREELVSACVQNLRVQPDIAMLMMKNRLIDQTNAFDCIKYMNNGYIATLMNDMTFSSIETSPAVRYLATEYDRSSLCFFLQTYYQLIKEELESYYRSNGKEFLDLTIQLLSQYSSPIKSVSRAVSILERLTVKKQYKNNLSKLYNCPYNDVIYTHLTSASTDHKTNSLYLILLFIIKQCIDGTDFFDKIKEDFIASSDDEE
nr:RNA-dependent RNA polymerase [Pear chlorotic leaf spot-associated virus]